MAQQIFAYIAHKNGVVDDSAVELITAAQKLQPGAAVTAIVCGAGADLDAACNAAVASYAEVWKVENDGLAYPNAEAVRLCAQDTVVRFLRAVNPATLTDDAEGLIPQSACVFGEGHWPEVM